jgi:DNA/RNA tunnel of bacterial DNA dependent RNA polymerase.
MIILQIILLERGGNNMKVQFDPNNTIIKLCLQGMIMEENGKVEEAILLFQKAWSEATNDFEKFYGAYYMSRHQINTSDKLKWLEEALQLARRINNVGVISALPLLYSNIAACYKELDDLENASRNDELSDSSKRMYPEEGPFYHGTRADLQVGDMLTAGGDSNYKPNLKMNHIYFTAVVNGAGLAAALAKGEGRERVYLVEPMGTFENDPNVTDKKFPGNPTRSYRSQEPLKIIGEVTDWLRITPEELRSWRERLDKNKGEIIN